MILVGWLPTPEGITNGLSASLTRLVCVFNSLIIDFFNAIDYVNGQDSPYIIENGVKLLPI